MIIVRILAAAALLATTSANSAEPAPSKACPWPKELEAMIAAPGNHKILFENAHVRVLEATVAPHSREPIHTHCWPSTLYIQKTGRIIDRDGSGHIVFDSRKLKDPPKVRFVQWMPIQGPHSIENLDDVPLVLIRIEQKG